MTLKTDLIEKLSRCPSDPGVYLMKDKEGTVIYVGKAKHLKKRLASYFIKTNHLDVKTGVLVSKIVDFEILITKTEQEALILEANLIRRYKPQYNVILKDDKRYPLIRIHVKDPYPYIEKVRKIAQDGNLYFGPFAAASSLNFTLKFIYRTFKLRNCKKKTFQSRTRPCLNYQMGNCLGPCCLNVNNETYQDIVREVILFLKGRMPELAVKLKTAMTSAAENQDYETAAQLRDKWFAIEKVIEKQTVVSTDMADRDVIALARAESTLIITVLFVRTGYWISTRHFAIEDPLSDTSEIIGAFIKQYYGSSNFIPSEIIVPKSIEDKSILEQWLRDIKGKKVEIIHPMRGEKVRLLDMAERNATSELKDRIESGSLSKALLERLKQKLHLERLPSKIECFDNSNLLGDEPVSGMVVFNDGTPRKSLYRTYRIRDVKYQDDYAYMKEVLTRRYQKNEGDMIYPDLLMVDGGKGQLNIALSVLKELDIANEFQVVGIAKKDGKKGETEDKIFIPNRSNPINFGKDHDLLLFLQRIRDEAHRFAVSFHRKIRNRSLIHSSLDDIPGIGKKRRDMLLRTYGGISEMKLAEVEDLAALPGMNRISATRLKKHLESF
ncbi:MAG: excinuclease ABC subunit UvrC [Proteobacteria bacterium]|nr:excinuclease ABC subunit UvrC [Pseudomonadota bacterium]